jgi:hypothetical protein
MLGSCTCSRARGSCSEAQALAQAHLHHLQVGLDQAEFGGQAHLLAAHVAQAGAQEVDQVTGQFGGARRAVLGQLLHRAQGIEQEVRLDLGAQQAQLGFRQFARQAGLLGFALQLRVEGFVMAVAQDADDQHRHQDGQRAGQTPLVKCGHALHRMRQRLAFHPHRQRGGGRGAEHGKAQHRQQHLQFLPGDLAVVEPGADDGEHHRNAEHVGGNDRFYPAHAWELQVQRDAAQAKQRKQRGSPEPAAPALQRNTRNRASAGAPAASVQPACSK